MPEHIVCECDRCQDFLDSAEVDHNLAQDGIKIYNGLAAYITELQAQGDDESGWHPLDIADRLIEIIGFDPTDEPDE